MAERPKGMGRGLAAILSVAPRDELQELRPLPVDMIDPSPKQPRRNFDEDSLMALAGSIRARGVLQPVLVRPMVSGRYELIAGERRWRAAQLAELTAIPAVVRRHDDAASLEVALIENMAREDLSPVEEARACAALVEELGLTREEVGLRVGRSRVAVSNLIRLLDLPDEALELIERGDLTEGHGRDRGQLGELGSPPPPLAGDQLVATAGMGPDEYRLQDAASADRPGQGHQRFLVERAAGLVRAGVDHVDRNRAELLELVPGSHGQDRGEAAAHSLRSFSHARQPPLPARSTRLPRRSAGRGG